MAVKFTDVDYYVFHDAAEYITKVYWTWKKKKKKKSMSMGQRNVQN